MPTSSNPASRQGRRGEHWSADAPARRTSTAAARGDATRRAGQGPPVTRARTGAPRAGRRLAWLLALLGAGLIAYALNAPAFTITQIAVTGASLTAVQDVATATGVLGGNIFTVDPQAVANRLGALPTVRRVEVWPELPDRLVVRLTERQPVAVWAVGGDRALVDEAGRVLLVGPSDEQARGLVVVAAREVAPPQVGTSVDAWIVHAAVTVAQGLGADGTVQLASFDYTPTSGLALATSDGRRIVLGTASRLDDKLAVLAVVLRDARGWKTLDLTDPDRPFYR